MASLDEFLAALFGSLGPVGSLLALLLIFAGDAALFPALPEAWIVVTYAYRPEVTDPLVWTALLLGTAVVGDVLGTTALYAVVRRVLVEGRRMPGWLVGAFIATLRWNYRRSIAYVAVGGLAKYAVLLFVVFEVGVAYDVATARWITLGLVVAVVALSFVGSFLVRRRATAPRS